MENSYADTAHYYDIDLTDADGDEVEEFQIVLDYLMENTAVCGHDVIEDIIVYADF